MALFNRRKENTDVLPTEVREYYQSERRERTGLAWLLALGTLLVTFLIAAGLFFGGRWVYRTVFNDDKKPVAEQQKESKSAEEKSDSNKIQSTNSPSSNTGTSSTSTSTPSTSTTPSSSTPTTTTPSTQPATIPNTGPGDEE